MQLEYITFKKYTHTLFSKIHIKQFSFTNNYGKKRR